MPGSLRLFMITVDCDLRAPDVGGRDAALRWLLRTFTTAGVAGHVTWFLNENDFAITVNHAPFVAAAVAAGDTLGVHDHLDKFKRPLAAADLLAYCRASRDAVRAVAGPGLLPHRNGCLTQDPEIYRALAQLGYTVLSDVYPGHAGDDHARHPSNDNREMPIGIRPYRHDPASWADYRTCIAIAPGEFRPFMGRFLHVPIAHLGVDLDMAAIDRWVAAAEATEYCEPPGPGETPITVTWLFHPYEILNPERTAVDPARLDRIRAQVADLRRQGFWFVNMQECVAAYRGILYTDTWP